MSYKIVFTSKADADLDEIVHFIREVKNNYSGARKVFSYIRKAIDELRDNPGIYPVSLVSPFDEAEVHIMGVKKKYRVLYQIDKMNKCIYILRIVGATQELSYIKFENVPQA